MNDETQSGQQGDASSKPRQKLRLDQFLKFKGMVSTGGEAKVRIQTGEVLLNGEVCTQRGRGLRVGDVVEWDGLEETVTEEDIG